MPVGEAILSVGAGEDFYTSKTKLVRSVIFSVRL